MLVNSYFQISVFSKESMKEDLCVLLRWVANAQDFILFSFD